MEKQFCVPLQGVSTHQIAVGHMIRIVNVTPVPVVFFHDRGFMGQLLFSQKLPSTGGGSILVSM